jgi:hypothetical protein
LWFHEEGVKQGCTNIFEEKFFTWTTRLKGKVRMGKRLQKCIFLPSKAKNTLENLLHIHILFKETSKFKNGIYLCDLK